MRYRRRAGSWGAPVTRWARRVDDRRKIALIITVFVSCMSGISMFFYGGIFLNGVVGSRTFNPGLYLALDIAEAQSRDSTDRSTRVGQILDEPTIFDDPKHDFPEDPIGTGIGWLSLGAARIAWPLLYIVDFRGEAERAIRISRGAGFGTHPEDAVFAPQPAVMAASQDVLDTKFSMTPLGAALALVAFNPATPTCPDTTCQSFQATVAPDAQVGSSQAVNTSVGESVEPPTPSLLGPAGWVEIVSQPSPASAGIQAPHLMCAGYGSTTSAINTACSSPMSWASGLWGLSFQYGRLEGAFNPSDWHLSMDTLSDIHFSTASALQTPLQNFGIEPTWGIGMRTPGGLEMIGSPLGAQVLQHITMPVGEFLAGITPQGPVGGVQIVDGTVTGYLTTLFSAGQVESVWTLSLRAADVNISVSQGTSDLQFGLSYAMPGGATVQTSWSAANGFQIGLTLPVGDDLSATAPVGAGSLAFGTPLVNDGSSPSVRFRLPLATPVQASTSAAASMSPASPSALVIRICVDSQGNGVCGQAQPTLPLQVLVDGVPVIATGAAIPISPGHHTITLSAEIVPPHLAPLHGLTCDLIIPASTVGTCDLAFQRVATP